MNEPQSTTGADDMLTAAYQRAMSLEVLAALRQRFVETAARYANKGDTTNFRRWRKAKDAVREIDAMIAAAEKDQPQ